MCEIGPIELTNEPKRCAAILATAHRTEIGISSQSRSAWMNRVGFGRVEPDRRRVPDVRSQCFHEIHGIFFHAPAVSVNPDQVDEHA